LYSLSSFREAVLAQLLVARYLKRHKAYPNFGDYTQNHGIKWG
jgi:hypothetical protein